MLTWPGPHKGMLLVRSSRGKQALQDRYLLEKQRCAALMAEALSLLRGKLQLHPACPQVHADFQKSLSPAAERQSWTLCGGGRGPLSALSRLSQLRCW